MKNKKEMNEISNIIMPELEEHAEEINELWRELKKEEKEESYKIKITKAIYWWMRKSDMALTAGQISNKTAERNLEIIQETNKKYGFGQISGNGTKKQYEQVLSIFKDKIVLEE